MVLNNRSTVYSQRPIGHFPDSSALRSAVSIFTLQRSQPAHFLSRGTSSGFEPESPTFVGGALSIELRGCRLRSIEPRFALRIGARLFRRIKIGDTQTRNSINTYQVFVRHLFTIPLLGTQKSAGVLPALKVAWAFARIDRSRTKAGRPCFPPYSLDSLRGRRSGRAPFSDFSAGFSSVATGSIGFSDTTSNGTSTVTSVCSLIFTSCLPRVLTGLKR